MFIKDLSTSTPGRLKSAEPLWWTAGGKLHTQLCIQVFCCFSRETGCTTRLNIYTFFFVTATTWVYFCRLSRSRLTFPLFPLFFKHYAGENQKESKGCWICWETHLDRWKGDFLTLQLFSASTVSLKDGQETDLLPPCSPWCSRPGLCAAVRCCSCSTSSRGDPVGCTSLHTEQGQWSGPQGHRCCV